MKYTYIKFFSVFLLYISIHSVSSAQAGVQTLHDAVDLAVSKVKPALVRIHVVSTAYYEGREEKYVSSGSGVIISPEGHVITNHHVAGHAKLLKCTFANKEKIEAELIGSDPLTDLAIIKLKNENGTVYPTASFGDSSGVSVGDHVLAMGSPLSLSQSVTLGIISNAEMIMPRMMGRYRGLMQDGEDVGGLVKWLGHDAQIFPGNSGGPLVNLAGEIIGINEISMGLGGAIPGNLAQKVATELIKDGSIKRAWIGLQVQPRLKNSTLDKGVVVSGVIKDSPADEADIKAGDVILKIDGEDIDVEFAEQIPEYNLLVTELEIGKEVNFSIFRNEQEINLSLKPIKHEKYQPEQFEVKSWGITVRNLSFMLAKALKRESRDGVLVTSVRPGGGAGDAKPAIDPGDVIVQIGDTKVDSVEEFFKETEKILKNADETVHVLTEFERKSGKYVTVVEVGIKDIDDPGLEVKKAWLPVEVQVITRDIAEALEDKSLKGFRIIKVYDGTTADKAGLEIGDYVLAVDGEALQASQPEDLEELETLIRQYRVGDKVVLSLLRGGKNMEIEVELIRSPKLIREMKRYKDENFEFTVRDITFFDKADEKWEEKQKGVMVNEVSSGGWAALGGLQTSDLILEVDNAQVNNVDSMREVMEKTVAEKPDFVLIKVLRRISTLYIELEPKWDLITGKGNS